MIQGPDGNECVIENREKAHCKTSLHRLLTQNVRQQNGEIVASASNQPL